MDLWTRENIRNYTGDPDEANDINYSLEQQEIRKAIRKLDIETKEQGGVIDWNYMLNDMM
tara:strand:- start:383 stop:562 length:180 start_codon:yes stop_codon:yes gene_type:complete